MARMTGGQAVVASLIHHGVDTLFAIPGVQLDHLFNALYEARNAVRVVHTRHEQGAAYMAYGYAAATGRAGAYAAVPGPGFLNTTAALSTAYAANAPVLALIGQIPSHAIGRGFGLLHEIPDQLAILRSLTKWAARIEHPSRAPELVRRAFEELGDGRVRPVGLEIAPDVLAAAAEVGAPEDARPAAPPPLDEERIEEAACLLGKADRPLIFAGSGCIGAGEALAALAEALEAPVVLNRAALGVIDDRHPLVQPMPVGHRLWAEADVVLGVGTRLNPQVPSWGLDEALKIVRIDVDPVEIGRAGRPAVGIVGDAKRVLEALAGRIGRHSRARPSRRAELGARKAELRAELERNLGPQIALLDAIRRALPEDGILVEDLTQIGYVSRFAFPIHRERTFITTGYQGTLGFGFATALGVKAARPEAPVVSISGDGGFMYTVQELATAVQHGIGVVAVVLNDGAYGNVRRMQVEDYGGKVIATELRNPDFVRLAESFGAAAERADGPAALEAALRRAFDRPGPTLIEVPVGEMPSPWAYLQMPRARPVAG